MDRVKDQTYKIIKGEHIGKLIEVEDYCSKVWNRDDWYKLNLPVMAIFYSMMINHNGLSEINANRFDFRDCVYGKIGVSGYIYPLPWLEFYNGDEK